MDRPLVPAFPYVEFTVSVGTWDWASEAYVNTGFEGAISIPYWLIPEIDAEPGESLLGLADGTVRSVPSWSGVLSLEGRRFQVEVVAIGKRCLLGREVMDQIEVCLRFGQEVRLTFAD